MTDKVAGSGDVTARRSEMVQISPSILSADFSRLGEQVALIEASGADRIHFDVMDGRFVPNISFGAIVLAAIRPFSRLPMDVHLMVADPERHIGVFAEAGADSITVHAEATVHLDRLLREIRAAGKMAGVSLNPATPLNVLDHVLHLADLVLLMTVNPGFGGQSYISGMTEKTAALRARIDREKCSAVIHLDGGIGLANVRTVTEAGADVLVAGTAFFSSKDPADFIRQMKMTSKR
jgi:ribulose-phosphate 3-epimerase